MKRFFAFLLIICLALSLCACGRGSIDNGGEGLEIVTTVFPAYDFACHIAGDKARVTLLVPPGSETHSFEPTPRDVITLQSCDLLICNGGESEQWLEALLEGQEGEIPCLQMLQCVETVTEEIKEGMQTSGHSHEHDQHEHHDHDEHGEPDEHEWTSPVNAILICRQICARLCAIDPDNAEYYVNRLDAYSAQLEALDAEFRDIAENARFKTLIFADRFPVRYFTEEYGYDYFAAFPGCADDTEPSARTVAFLIDRVREEHIPVVFYVEFSNQKMADVVCEDTGCNKLLFHSCHNVTAGELKQGISYLDIMWDNAARMREALYQ